MRRIAAFAWGWAGCAGPAPGTTPDGDPDPTDEPPAERCADPGPDAPVIASVTPTVSTFEGFDVLTYLPPSMAGVVFYFYGSDDVDEWLGYEQTAFANAMAAADIGYVVTERTTPGSGARWDDHTLPWSDNLDVARLDRLRAELVATTALDEDTPVISAGFSDGGSFSLFFGTAAVSAGWPVAAVLVHSASAQGVPLPDVPVWTTAGAHDDAPTRDGALRVAEEQAERGFLARHVPIAERTLTAAAFERDPDWDAAKAEEAFADVAAAGLVDATGARLVADDGIESALTSYGRESAMRGSAIAESRVRVVWATHRYNAVPVQDACAFVLDALDRAERRSPP